MSDFQLNDIYTLKGVLDFGSLRDLNRHRVGARTYHRASHGNFHPWYIEMLNAHGVRPIDPYYCSQTTATFHMSYHHVPLLGMTYNYQYTCDRDQANYISRLRTKLNVHWTLRQEIINQWGDVWKDRITATPDVGPFGYYLVRGNDYIAFNGKEL